MDTLGVLADILGICSFLLTILLLIRSEAIRKEIESQRVEYKREQSTIKKDLIALRHNVWQDDLLNIMIISQIRTHIYAFQQKYMRLLSRNDKKHKDKILLLLKNPPDAIDKSALCNELDYFIARFERREIK